jgi:hypothetical protein
MPSTNLRCQLPSEDDYLCNHSCTLDWTRLFVFSARLINSYLFSKRRRLQRCKLKIATFSEDFVESNIYVIYYRRSFSGVGGRSTEKYFTAARASLLISIPNFFEDHHFMHIKHPGPHYIRQQI